MDRIRVKADHMHHWKKGAWRSVLWAIVPARFWPDVRAVVESGGKATRQHKENEHGSELDNPCVLAAPQQEPGSVAPDQGKLASLQELQQQTTPLYDGSAPSYDPPQDLSYGTSYWWRVDEVFAGGSVTEGSPWGFTTKELMSVLRAAAEIAIDGVASGDLQNTRNRDNACEAITEALNVASKNGYSTLQHIWRFDNVPAAANLQLRIEAHQTVGSDGDSKHCRSEWPGVRSDRDRHLERSDQ